MSAQAPSWTNPVSFSPPVAVRRPVQSAVGTLGAEEEPELFTESEAEFRSDAIAAGFEFKKPAKRGRVALVVSLLAATSIAAATLVAVHVDGPPKSVHVDGALSTMLMLDGKGSRR